MAALFLILALAGRRERDDLIDLTMMDSGLLFSRHDARRHPRCDAAGGRKSSTNQAEPGDADHDQIDGDDVIEKARHEQDQNSGEQRDERLDMGDGYHGAASWKHLVNGQCCTKQITPKSSERYH
jgi:hypothetical protein